MTTDAELLVAARTDPTAFRELYERYAPRVHGFHLARARDPQAAHDLTAETFAQAWLVRRRFRDEAGGSAGPWLFAIARHVLSASVRRRRIEQSACARLGLLLPRETEAAQPTEVWLDGLDEALAGLTQGEHDAIRLRVLGDLEYDEVARELRTTPAAARVRVHRGLTKLRNRLTQRTEAAG
jgi:RNA polymerase sigma-70 factor (ECF subfamily)